MENIKSSRVLWYAVLLSFAIAAHPATAGEPFRPFRLKTLEGEQKTLADVLGRKATLVVFFFPTCKFCNVAFPEIQRLYDTYKDQGLSVVWINALPKEERLVADWRTKHGYTVPVLVGASIRTVSDYKITITPTHYLLDSKGNVIFTHAGYKSGDEQELERQIKQALE